MIIVTVTGVPVHPVLGGEVRPERRLFLVPRRGVGSVAGRALRRGVEVRGDRQGDCDAHRPPGACPELIYFDL